MRLLTHTFHGVGKVRSLLSARTGCEMKDVFGLDFGNTILERVLGQEVEVVPNNTAAQVLNSLVVGAGANDQVDLMALR